LIDIIESKKIILKFEQVVYTLHSENEINEKIFELFQLVIKCLNSTLNIMEFKMNNTNVIKKENN